MITEAQKVLLHLSLIKEIGAATIHKIIHFLIRQQSLLGFTDFVNGMQKASPSQSIDMTVCYAMTVRDWQIAGCTLKQAEAAYLGLKSHQLLNEELALLEKHQDIYITTLIDASYPALLRHIHMPPPLLYIQGNFNGEYDKRLSIVGSRDADAYGKKVIELLVPSLVSAGWEIVSGGARGADAFAHAATFHVRGRTQAVLGSGLLQRYPQENDRLFNMIIDHDGALISSFPLMMGPERGHFPARNRIIAGLTKGSIVVQAAQKSGALITAEFALEQGRSVFAVPGSIFHPLSQGCHKVLQMGAKLISSVDDIFEEFGELKDQNKQLSAIEHAQKMVINPEDNKVLSAHDSQRSLLDLMLEPVSIDFLAASTRFSLEELQDQLFTLQLDGKIQQTFAGLWEQCS